MSHPKISMSGHFECMFFQLQEIFFKAPQIKSILTILLAHHLVLVMDVKNNILPGGK